VTRNTNTSKTESIVDEQSTNSDSTGGTSQSPGDDGTRDAAAVNDDLLATLAEVES
jgi:hypothetical protein